MPETFLDDPRMGAEIHELYDIPTPRRRRKHTREVSIQATVTRAIEQAQAWHDENLEPYQTRATKYYQGEELGNEVEGRSKVVMTTVRDVVRPLLATCMRIMTGPERLVEYKPRRADQIEKAREQTDVVNYLVTMENNGFLELYSVLKDAFVRKMGVMAYWYEESTRVEGREYTDVPEPLIGALLDRGGEVVEQTEVSAEVTEPILDPTGQDTGQIRVVEPALYDVTVRRKYEASDYRIAAVPPEEFVFSANARSRDDVRMMGQAGERPANELVALGIDVDVVHKHLGPERHGTNQGEQLEHQRRIDGGGREYDEDVQVEETRPVQFADIYMQLPVEDEDGLTEWRHLWCIGKNYKIVKNEPSGPPQYAIFMADPEPHTMVGLCPADYVMDLQEVDSMLARGMLDSLSLSLDPAMEIVDGAVNIKDVLNKEIGRVIRARRPGMMREVAHSFVAAPVLDVLQWSKEVKQNRTGSTDAAEGLDADVMQSTTKAAVQGTFSRAQLHKELIVRTLAETGLKDLFRGMLRLVSEHQDKDLVVRLRGQYVAVNPDHWDPDLDVVTNVALGAGMPEERIATLSMLVQKLEMYLEKGVPFVSFSKLREALVQLMEMTGYPHEELFLETFSPEQEQQWRQQQAQQAQQADPDGTKLLAQVEREKIEAGRNKEQMETQLALRKLAVEDARARDEAAMKFAIEMAKLKGKEDEASVKAAFELQRELLKVEQAEIDLALKLSEPDDTAE